MELEELPLALLFSLLLSPTPLLACPIKEDHQQIKSLRLTKGCLKTCQQFKLQISVLTDTSCSVDVQGAALCHVIPQQVTSPLAAHSLRATHLQQLHVHNCRGKIKHCPAACDPSENTNFSWRIRLFY